jgi:hypothetical protein
MTQKIRDEGAEVLRFGGGQNSRSSEDQIDPLECTGGQNYILDPGNGEFRPRGPFDLIGTVPNGAEIRGFVTLQKSDGTVTMLVQAGAVVYSWDGASTFTVVGTVNQLAKLRGPREANWALDDKVIVSDINLQEELHEWDGTTFQQVAFIESDGSTSFGTFRARYCIVENERAFYANIYDNGASFPHLLVSSQRGDYTVVAASGMPDADRPSSSHGDEDPWFLPVPQLKPINGLAFAFGLLAISQSNGAFERLSGSTAKDFSLTKLHDGSGASGFESVVATSNDIVYGAPGRIESLESTDKFGDVEFDDLSFKIKTDIEDYTGWMLVYNPRQKRIYCFPEDQQEVWVLHIDFIGTDLSPWAKWTTRHALSFLPSAVMVCRDPSDGLEYTFMGDSQGNLYRLEGTGANGDGGTDPVEVERTSKLFSAGLDTKAFHIDGWLQQRKLETSSTVTLRFLFSGEHPHDVEKRIVTSAVVFDTPYGGAVYYGGNFYYGPKQLNRLVRKLFGVPGLANQFQVEVSVEGQDQFAITEIGLRYDISS